MWTFFDPRPAFAQVNTISEMVSNRIYFIGVFSDQTVTLNGTLRNLTGGWNVIAW